MAVGRGKIGDIIKNEKNGGRRSGKIGDIIKNVTNGGRKNGKHRDIIKKMKLMAVVKPDKSLILLKMAQMQYDERKNR
jgi:hypothetical protein